MPWKGSHSSSFSGLNEEEDEQSVDDASSGPLFTIENGFVMYFLGF